MGYGQDTRQCCESGSVGQSIADALRTLTPGKENVLQVIEEITADGKKNVQFSFGQRTLNPEDPPKPIKAISPKRAHVLYDVAGFIAYLSKYKTEDTVVLADPVTEKISAIINEKSTDGFEIIEFVPTLHPLFAPWSKLVNVGKAIPIKDFVDFVGTNRRAVTEPDGKDLRIMLAQVRMSRNVQLYQGSGKNATNGYLIQTKVDGGAQGETIEIPETFQINVPIYVGAGSSIIEIDLMLGGDEDTGVTVTVTAGDVTQKKSDQFDAFLVEIKKSLTDVTISTGRPGHKEWEFLRRQ